MSEQREPDYVYDTAYETEQTRVRAMHGIQLNARLQEMRHKARVARETGYSSGWYDAIVDAIVDEMQARVQLEGYDR